MIAVGKKLKYKKFDSDGNQIIERFSGYYIAKTPLGDTIQLRNKGGLVSDGAVERGRALSKREGARSNGFDKNPQNVYRGNNKVRAANVKKAMQDADLSWKINQRECLRRMMSMTNGEIYTYLVAWKQADKAQVVRDYDYYVADDDLAKIEDLKPTMTQLATLTMVLKAQVDAKFAMTILEMLEGKAVSVAQIKENKPKKEEAPVTNEVDEALNKLKESVLADTTLDELPPLPEKKKKESLSLDEAVEAVPALEQLQGEDLLKALGAVQ